MGRYRRNKHRGRKQNRKRDTETDSSTSREGDTSSSTKHNASSNNTNKNSSSRPHYFKKLTETDWILVEKYILEYRSKAYEIHCSDDQVQDNNVITKPFVIGSHSFPPLTNEVCSRPYLDLPDTLGPKERRQIHTLCAYLDLYHSGAGSVDHGNVGIDPLLKPRRIVISIFANGLDYVPDLESPHSKTTASSGEGGSPPLPSRMCRPWFYRANKAQNGSKNKNWINNQRNESRIIHNSNTTNCEEISEHNPFIERIQMIEHEKQQIRKFVIHPEQLLRTAPRIVDSSLQNSKMNQLDSLDLSELESLDLSCVPTPQETPWMLVDSVEKLKQCVQELKFGLDHTDESASGYGRLHELAFDMEMHNHGNGGHGGGNSRHPNKLELRTCLIQITSNVTTFVTSDSVNGDNIPKEMHKDYVIDPLAPGVWDAIPTHLGPLFANPNIVKIGHGIGGMDTSSLHRDFGIVVVNAFDTYEAANVIVKRSNYKRFLSGLGLASLCKHYGLPSWKEYQDLKRQYQCSDWRKRPLEEEALEYGRYDVRYLTMLRKLLIRDLVNLELSNYNRGGFTAMSSSNLSEYDSMSMSRSNDESSILYSSDSRLDSNISSSDPALSVSDFGSNNGAKRSEEEADNDGGDILLDEFKDAKDNYDAIIVETSEESEDVFVDSFQSDNSSSPSPKLPRLEASELPRCGHLMNAISVSQKRCLNLWTDEDEPILHNHSVTTLMKHAALKKGHGKYWTDAHMQFYKQLVEWRKDVAQREEIHSSELCSLDFLVHVAYKLPNTRWGMRRYGYFLPALLEDDNLPYCEELCNLVICSEVFHDQSYPPLSEMTRCDIVFYSEDGKKTPNSNGEKIDRDCRQDSFRRTAYKLLVASALVGAVALVVTKHRRR